MPVWETLQHHQALIDDKEAYAKLGAAIQKAAADKQYLYHVNYSAEIYTALDAPVTEFAIWTINQGTPREQFKACLGEIIARADADPTLKDEVFRGSWGAIVEDERKFMVTLGWHSLEVRARRLVRYEIWVAHGVLGLQRFSAAVYNAKELVELITSVKQLAELDLKHTKLTKFWKE